MSWLLTFARSSIGAKVIMALTGAAMYGFLLVHMAGNLLVFAGPEYLDHHSVFLHSMPELIWPARLALLGAIVAHIGAMIVLRKRSGEARPVAYKTKQNRAATIYSRTMAISGPIVLIFIVVHLLNLTLGVIHPDFKLQAEFSSPAAFHNTTVLLGQVQWGVFYIVCNLLLGLHLWHGAYAMFRTLGLAGERQQGVAKLVASGLTGSIVGGNVLIAAAILLGLVK
jgi:succinate dehydrogenase / fumarate reductase cytochrome b subunit